MTTLRSPEVAPARATAPTESNRPARARVPMRPRGTTFVSVLAVATSSWALNPLLAPGRWAVIAFAACVVLAWGTAWLRTRTRHAVVPTLVGLALVAYGLTVAYLSPPRELGLLPDGDTLRRLSRLVEETGELILVSVAPLEITPGLEAAAIGGICVVYLLVELCSFGLRTPAWSAVPLLALWAPAIVIYIEVSALTFFCAAVTYLGLMALANDAGILDADERRRRTMIAAAWSLTLAALTLVITPLVLLAPGWGSNRLPFLGSGGPGAILLDNEIDMRQNLGQQSAEVALRYTVTGATVGALRLRTMHEFDGASWHADDTPGAMELPGQDTLLWSEDVVSPALLEGEQSTVDVEIASLREDRLAIPTFPSIVDAGDRWRYDSGRDEVLSSRRTTPGERYSFRTVATAITPELLRSASSGEPRRAAAYLDTPSSPYAAEIAQRAREVTADATTTYDQAMLLQTYLRGPQFSYETVVPAPETGDAVWDFLESGEGYCVQFATAMTVMARTLGIPARMAVGFLPGTAASGSPRAFEVRGDRAHTWPELHFEGIGWVRFEPTPAVQSGLPPGYADPFANEGDGPTAEPEIPTATSAPSAPVAPTAQPTSGGVAGGVGRALGETPGWALAIAVVAALLLAAAVVLVIRRARHRGTVLATPESAWRRMRERLSLLGITWPDSATPRSAAAEIRRQLARRTGAPVGVDALEGLALLVSALEAERYAPSAAAVSTDALEAAVAAVLAGAAVTAPTTGHDRQPAKV